jgi:hypothetical protein
MEVFRSESDNFTPDQIKAAVEQVGFKSVRRYADLFLEKRFVRNSRDIVLTARRSLK